MRKEIFLFEKNKNFIKLFLCLFGLVTFSLRAQQSPLFMAGKNPTYREPQESLIIQVPKENLPTKDEKFSLELDNVDVTEMIQYEDNKIIFSPVQAMSPGSHELKLLKYTEDDNSQELGLWRFEVRQSATFKQYGASANIELTDTYRLDEKNLFEPLPKRQQIQGSTQVNYSADTGNWHTQGQFDLIYNSSNDGQFGARKLDNGEFLFSVGNGTTALQVGHQTIGEGSMVMDGFRRRGVSIGGNFSTLQSKVTGFVLSSEDVVGFRRGLAVNDANRRVDGVNFVTNPFADETLSISGTWLTGRQQDETGFVASIDSLDPATSQGSAQSLKVKSQLLESKLQLQLEYANTRFDTNATDSIQSQNDNAYHFKASYSDVTESGTSWNAGVESGRVGPFFKSLANQGLQADNRSILASGGVQWSTVGLQANLQRQNDNVKGLVELPRIQTDVSSVSLNWTPILEAGESWFGTPSLDTTFSRQDQKQTLTPTDSFLSATNNTLDNWQTNASFNYLSGSWGVALGSNKLRDFSGIQNDSDTTSFGMNGSMSFLQQTLNFSPSIQFDRTEDLQTNLISDSITYSLQSTFTIIQDELDGSLLLSMSRNQTTDNSINSDANAASLTLNWRALEAKPNRPGLNFGLSGQYNDTKDKIFISNSLGTYQIFLTFTIVFPAQLGVVQ